MWNCSHCKEKIEDKYEFCWKCGLKHLNLHLTKEEIQKDKELGVPSFQSIDELVPPPPKYKESLNEQIGGSIIEIVIGVFLTVIVIPIIRAVFSPYSFYISIAFIAMVVLFIIWKVFRDD